MTTHVTITDFTQCQRSVRTQPTTIESIGATWIAFTRWRARRRTEHILAGLSDQTLKDIGLTANEIGSVVHGSPGERLQRYDASWDEPSNS